MTTATETNVVLVAEDDAEIATMLRDWLQGAGYTVATAPDGRAALRTFFERRPQLSILDILMPEMNGFELCRRIREVSNAPVIFLTALGQEKDKVEGLGAGADDYITKPVASGELVARVNAILRRARDSQPAEQQHIYADKVLTIYFDRWEVFCRGQRLELTPIEYKLLRYFVRNAGRVLTPNMLLGHVWGMGYEEPERVVWHVSRLRRKIELDADSPQVFITVRGGGYRYMRPL
ncbi:MAG: response regulator transcription factor [Chloroflexi bacterium]|nr:response regulator transcription factor [Chloroflexota bacterium]